MSKQNLWTLIGNFSEYVHTLIGYIGTSLLIAMGIVGTLQIISRLLPEYFIPFPLVWTGEIIRFLMVLISAMGLPYAMYNDSHISFRRMIKRYAGSKQYVLIFISNIFVAVLCLILLFSSIIVMERTLGQTLPTVGWIRVGYGHGAIAVMCLLTVPIIAAKLYESQIWRDE